jgi:hypothetical protein
MKFIIAKYEENPRCTLLDNCVHVNLFFDKIAAFVVIREKGAIGSY